MRPGKYFVVMAAAMLLTGTALAQGGAPYVFVSNPDAGQIVKVVDATTYTVLFEHRRTEVEDLVVGPDDLLYACAPEDGLVFRFDPESVVGAPLSIGDVTIIYDGPLALQCGWFSDLGDLFTTGSDDAVWVFNGLVPLDPPDPAPPWPPAPTLLVEGTNFGGQGVTQAAPGDLLYVSQNQGAVFNLSFDPIFRFNAPGNAPSILIDDLDNPVGVARSGDGTVFVATDNGLEAYQNGGLFCSASSTDFGGQDPQFLAVTADDTLYVATNSKKAGTLWEVETDCDIVGDIITFARPDWKPSMSGVAVPRTFRTEDPTSNPLSQAELFFGFKDHAYELTFTPTGSCETDPITATETPPDCLRYLIDNYIFTDENDIDDDVFGTAVTYAGDGGVAQLYTVTGNCDVGPPNEIIEHAISAFTALVRNPRAVRCSFPAGTDFCSPPPANPDTAYCEVIELDSFFPFNGVFPDDGRIGSRSSSASFSEYFFADITLAEDGGSDNTPGCFCGWESPLPDIDYIPEDPFNTLPAFNSGSSVPLKFRVAALGPGDTCESSDPCATAPYGYVTGAEVLLSVARVRDAANLEVFEPIRPVSQSASVPGIIFGNPNSPSTPFHYNLDTSGYETGIYQAVAVALTDNFEVEWTYFYVD